MKTKFEICEVCNETEEKCTCHYCKNCGLKISYDQEQCYDCRRISDEKIKLMYQ